MSNSKSCKFLIPIYLYFESNKFVHLNLNLKWIRYNFYVYQAINVITFKINFLRSYNKHN